ncbi:MAG TPA: hypothetical protein VHX13_00525 [Acidobacteriaceae bacterium]|nr:hypothetical protein [Acidobacteriaceae bacterium]
MKNAGWFSPKGVQSIAGSIGLAVLLMTTGAAVAQDATTTTQPTAPNGYTLHESIDLGGHIAGIDGSGAMYDTMVNLHSGPRVLGEHFELRAQPGAKNTLVDSLSAFSNGWGGDPNNYSRLDFHKGNLYEFSGVFRRDRQYFDYDLLGNPNIPSGQSLPIGPTASPTGSYAWPQVNQSPFLYNTVRRMTDTHLTLFPLSRIAYRAGYSHNTFGGPSLTPSGYQVASSYDILLQEMQRNSTDDFYGAVDWKILPETRLTYEEQIDHYKEDSYFNLDPAYLRFQEPDGTKVALAADYDALTPGVSCNANSVGTTPDLSAPSRPGGLPVINPACSVFSSYNRYQPTRILYPTEILRFQSSSIRNLSMNGDVRYTRANMNLPHYQDIFQGLAKTTRYLDYTATASAKREVMAVDYAAEWQATQKLSVSDQLTFSNVQQPGTATMTSVTSSATAATAGNETINSSSLTTTVVNKATTPATSTFEGSGSIGTASPDFFGQRNTTNDVTATWDGWSRATVSLTYRYRNHIIAEGIPHNTALAVGATSDGTVTINQNGGVFSAAIRPNDQWNINGSAEVLYADNVFTPVAPRQQQHYRVHALYRPKSWGTLSAAYNDLEIHNNTNNTGTPSLAGPLDHVAHTRAIGVGANLNPSEHYAFNFNYGYTDVYTATNICYLGGASPALPIQASTASGTACPGAGATRSGGYDFGPAKDFEDAPSQYVSAAVVLSPSKTIHSDIGYNLNYVDGTRFYNDPRDVAGSLNSKYQSPFANLAWTVHPGFIWNVQYNLYRYDEGGPSGAPYCSMSGPTATGPASVVPCNSSTLAGLQIGLTLPNSGETAAREFHANVVTLGLHYEF